MMATSHGGDNNETTAAKATTTTKTCYMGVPTPFWFNEESAGLFRDMEVRDDDIILSSGVKMGTTWVTRILISLLYNYDENGNPTKSCGDPSLPHQKGQVYPDALFPTREALELAQQRVEAEAGNDPSRPVSMFGNFTFEDLLHQPKPRMFSTHLFGKRMLPARLFDDSSSTDNKEEDGKKPIEAAAAPEGKGRLIVVLRNPKDTLASVHFFRGEPKDGWLGNEHGPGSYNRFIDLDDCPNAYGNVARWIRESDEAVSAIGSKRAIVLYYEDLKMDFPSEVRRLNDFLGLPPLSDAKLKAVSDACTIENTRANSKHKETVRKGVVGDWKNHLDEDHWSKLDQVFERALKDVAIAKPLLYCAPPPPE